MELLITELHLIRKVSNYKKVYPYPPVIQDMCFVVDDDTEYRGVRDAIMTSKAKDMIEKIETIDIFRNDETPIMKEGQVQKQVTIRIYFNSYDKQVTSEEVEVARKWIIRRVKEKVDGELK